jgi:ferrous iron transport protein B
MKMSERKFALVGNPNSGKSTLFNALTGLDQKVGNFPGVTVDLYEGHLKLDATHQCTLVDLPGAYSLHANTKDEFILTKQLVHPSSNLSIHGIIYVLDARYLNKQLLLLSQVLDLGFQVVVALSFTERLEEEDRIHITEFISENTSCKVIPIHSKSGKGIPELKEALLHLPSDKIFRKPIYQIPAGYLKELESNTSLMDKTLYHRLMLKHYQVDPAGNNFGLNPFSHPESIQQQIQETMSRYTILDNWVAILNKKHHPHAPSQSVLTRKLDAVATHPLWGYVLFLAVILIVFHSIFSLASIPMDWIEEGFLKINLLLKHQLPQHWSVDLLTDGVLAGLSGILVFVPQIAILFFLITILEEAGYMARVVFLFDRFLGIFGLNGRSIIGLISGGACAVPAIMSSRTIGSWRDRLLTMFVIPLIPCSARIPVYAALVGFLIPTSAKGWWVNPQGLVFVGLYALGIVAALLTALLLKQFVKTEEKSFLLIQLPDYQLPYFKQVLSNTWHKVYSFISEAGKIIIIMSMIIWFLCTYSLPGRLDQVETNLNAEMQDKNLTEIEKANIISAAKLENSFAGIIGKHIEPAIKPLGFDWKIGIALLTSFAAREVFVGTMATIYQLGAEAEDLTLRERMQVEKRADGSKFFNMKTALSLILFYAFAMQCMSTLAVMKRETGNWKWPLLQFIYMSALAYLSSLLVYQLL